MPDICIWWKLMKDPYTLHTLRTAGNAGAYPRQVAPADNVLVANCLSAINPVNLTSLSDLCSSVLWRRNKQRKLWCSWHACSNGKRARVSSMWEERTVEDSAFAYILRANEQNAGPATERCVARVSCFFFPCHYCCRNFHSHSSCLFSSLLCRLQP